jgi:thiol-disulfide isomerase/thioredoxin
MRIFLFLSLIFIFVFTVSAQNSPVNLEGQVVCCAECWAEADRTKVEYGTAEDLLKAISCVEGGDPTLLAVREGEKFTLYRLEQGKYKLPGKNWLEFVGKRVAVSGALQKKKNAGVIRVDRLEVLQKSIAELEAASVLGQTVELKLKDLFGTEQNLSQFKGRIVILNFWATYCEPCRKEMPDLAAIQNEYAALGVQVIGASTDAPEDRPKVLQFIKETKINFPIWMGAGSDDTRRFGLGDALPGTVVIDKTGKIVKVISGVVNIADLKKQIDSMLALAESSVEKPETAAKRENIKPKEPKASSVPS